MLKIGDFSALSRVSIKTLRYYDQTGLLRLRTSILQPATGTTPPGSFRSFVAFSRSRTSALRWSRYQVASPIRELYLKISMPVRQDDESYVTEIQVPVSKS
jgi:hypothetical protein